MRTQSSARVDDTKADSVADNSTKMFDLRFTNVFSSSEAARGKNRFVISRQ